MPKAERSTFARAKATFFISVFVLAALICKAGHDSLFAQNATPQNLFRAADVSEIEKIRKISPFGDIASEPETNILLARFPSKENNSTLVAIRFENKRCSEECMTVFFFENIGEERMAGAAYLPPAASMSDTSVAICEACQADWPIVFTGKSASIAVMTLGRGVIMQFRPTVARSP
jgi:hypothetical protein